MQQANGTQATMEALMQLLNHCAMHPHAIIHYTTSDMVLWTHSNASYLSAPKGRSQAAGYCFFSTQPTTPPSAHDEPPPNNGPVHILCQIMKSVMSSAAEAELGALFLNAQAICPMCTTLDELGHPQPATPLQTKNSTASGIANDTMKQKQSKAIAMHFYWVWDRVQQGQFHIFLQPGSTNCADYFTKHHPISHYQAICPTYLYLPSQHTNYYACLSSQLPAHPVRVC